MPLEFHDIFAINAAKLEMRNLVFLADANLLVEIGRDFIGECGKFEHENSAGTGGSSQESFTFGYVTTKEDVAALDVQGEALICANRHESAQRRLYSQPGVDAE